MTDQLPGYAQTSRTVYLGGIPYIKTRTLPDGAWRYRKKFRKSPKGTVLRLCTGCLKYRPVASFYRKKQAKITAPRAICKSCTRGATQLDYMLRILD